jgi:hypothetical protein
VTRLTEVREQTGQRTATPTVRSAAAIRKNDDG